MKSAPSSLTLILFGIIFISTLSCSKDELKDGSIFTDFKDIVCDDMNKVEGYSFDINKDGVPDVRFQAVSSYYGGQGGYSVSSVTGLNGWEVFSQDTIAYDNVLDVYADTIIYDSSTYQIPVIFYKGDTIKKDNYSVNQSDFSFSSSSPPVSGYQYFGCAYGAVLPADYFYIGIATRGKPSSLAWIKLKMPSWNRFIINSARCYKSETVVVVNQ